MRLRTSTASPRRRCSGLTLIETLLAGVIGALMLASLGAFTVYTARSFVAAGNYADLDQASRNSLDVMTRDIRESRGLTAFTTNKLTLSSATTNMLIYLYNPSTSTLTRQEGNNVTVLLEQCDYLSFKVYQRSPSNGFTFYPVQSNRWDLAKLVDVSWKCSRKILGEKVNTESVQTAKIVMRN
jgi:Tfp pilus assembly protein PilW